MVIQRSWKILSDSASTGHNSIGSDVQVRSPGTMQGNSSSDDSDCSNQTTHSMDTRAASPMKLMETDSTQETTLLSSAETTLKYVTTPEMAETMLQRIRQRYNGVHNLESGGSAESAMRALELLRISVQQAFDTEVNDIIKRYMNNYFKPAFGNIKENLGQHAVNEETLQKMSSCALLENAKAQYTNFVLRPTRQLAAATGAVTGEQHRVAVKRPAKSTEANSNNNSKLFANSAGVAVNAARPATEAANSGTTAQQAPPAPPAPPAPQQPQQPQQQQKPQTQSQSQSQPKQQQQQAQSQQTPAVQLQRNPLISGPLPTPVRRQIFWNTAQINTSTKFVLDVQANLAFGFSIDGKELGGARLASKHPEIIRYLPDAEDREWLAARGIIAAENRSSRFLFLIYDEVCRLQQTHELYRHKTNIDLSMMLTFNVTETMIQKMKLFFVDLNIKSRGLITNSFIVANNQQQPQQQQLSGNNNSHLRNALLQGAPAQPQLGTSTSAGEDQSSKDQSGAVATPCLQGTVVGSSTTNALKGKLIASSSSSSGSSSSSALSSSHATLTALLNQGGAASNPAPSGNSKFRN